MAVDIPYKRLQTGNNEIKGSLLVKYKLAKGLTVISLLAIILMAGYSLFHPGKSKKIFKYTLL
jgi:hypothetical protein